ncbi:MAG: Gfo/Idh/MocA family oxidoreductase [Proteobacteria bacterium]|nr:Gfo/Idh/MocA family oxidoreductase [Pseudomonadota bacterium]
MREYGVAVVGCGVGRMHIEAWKTLPGRFAVRSTCDVKSDVARRVADEFGIADATADFAAVLRRGDVDIVDICTPSATHGALAEAALAAGKHVVCEKPLAGSLAEVDRLKAAASRAKGRLMPIFQYRYGNGLLKLRHLMAKGLTGRLYLSTVETLWRREPAYYANPWRGKWKTELGGTLTTHAIHAHDILCWVAGPVRSVFARTATRVNAIEVEDCAAAALTLADGSLATLSVTVGAATDTSRLRFCFEHLTAESSAAPYTPGSEPWTFTPAGSEIGARIDAALADFRPKAERFAGQFADFHAALESGGKLPITVDDARAAIELLTALYHSAAAGAAVDLPLAADHPKYGGWQP